MSREQASSVPCQPDSLWVLTDLIMEYMRHRFHTELFPMTDPTSILPDVNIPTEMVCEVDQMSEILARARRNPEPAILIVESGEVITWYLPAAVMWESLKHIKISLPQSVGRSMDTKKWQMDSTLFQRDSKLVGTVNLSPAWFQQGHSVGAFTTFSLRHLI
ncbi:hypothetical protein PAXRUDRAFT_170419 [Paxillus rubicundulus Ve08.2h10]|uniref:Unplaced genomic scaffold scaffold_2760, whole genome shotgun sequence n=1 Tax=Paxillus rubicundulus Ve08.2h10 TaxID=930991 RepID=A0A0D0BYM0_9AGAM|nr:hypothetical protein PAXRUDRAFT_170419 [Paxillus rubicundulus Ve08.2h10]